VAYPVYSSVYISLGVESDLSAYPHTLYFKLKKPIDVGGAVHEFMTSRHYCYEPTFAPAGNSVVTIFFEADYDWWEKKKNDPAAELYAGLGGIYAHVSTSWWQCWFILAKPAIFCQPGYGR
jgi:hypothetical protein